MKVFVTGCFDMLHSGHVQFLTEASQYGDLYVGIGSDKTIINLKNRKPYNSEQERLFMVSSLKSVKKAFINSGSGKLDFINEFNEINPDVFFVNEDGLTDEKIEFLKSTDAKIIIKKRIPKTDLESRTTTQLRKESQIPYRLELCGGWMDQPFVNSLHKGSVITISLLPNQDFETRSGMATSSRNKAIEFFGEKLPNDDPEKMAKTLFSLENPPGTKNISGSQDQLGIIMPGINKLNYYNGYWPLSIESCIDYSTVEFLEKNIKLIKLQPRNFEFDVFKNRNENYVDAKLLSESSENAWSAIKSKDVKLLGEAISDCFRYQTNMFPNMINEDIKNSIDKYKNMSYGQKISGAGGGGYLILITDKNIPEAINIRIRT